jgi:predicted nucleic acid-binding protein
MNGPKTFVDTNVIVYAYDTTAGEKHSAARKIMMDLWRSGGGWSARRSFRSSTSP